MKKLTTLSNTPINQTPIEIALKIDENGMTTAKALYEFLELHPAHFAKWCKTNITNNAYAVESVDFTRFTLEGETPTGGKVLRKDYKLTATFAKKLAMSSNSPKGEMAKNYFITVEDKLKEVAQTSTVVSLQGSSNLSELEVLHILVGKAVEAEKRFQEQDETIFDMQDNMSNMQDDINYIKSNIDNAVVQVVEEMPIVERNNQQILLSEINGIDKVYFTTTDIAIAFGRKRATEINKYLDIHGIIKRCTTCEGWTITERYVALDLCSYSTVKAHGQIFQYIHWNERGVKFIVGFLKSKGLEQLKPVRRDPAFRRKNK